MELKDFIRDSLVQITDGVIEAEEICKKKGANVNPLLSGNKDMAMTPYNNSVSMVRYHIGLCDSAGSSDKRGIGVFLANVGIGYSGDEIKKLESVTSIDFSIPIKLHYSKTDEGIVYGR